jgi:glycosyltransferase involved in cell wall biosynthesis
MSPYTLMLPLYKGDRPKWVREALSSMMDQTYKPDETIVVIDGPVSPELMAAVDEYTEPLRIKKLCLSQNIGLGQALATALLSASNEIVVRMDADDIALRERCEKQITFIDNHPDIAVLGAQIAEFDTGPELTYGLRKVPQSPEAIRQMLPWRNPMNHMTVAFRKSAVLNVGGYYDFKLVQDYDLWGRLISRGYQCANLPEILVLARAGEKMFERRGGLEYWREERILFERLVSYGVVDRFRAVASLSIRGLARMMPRFLRKVLYHRIRVRTG